MIDIQKLVKNGTDFHMNTEYNRIVKGKRLTINGEPYNIMIFENLIKYFEKTEEYEKCNTLVNIRKKILDHEKNYLLKWNLN